MIETTKLPIYGYVTIEMIDPNTNEVIDHYEDHNTVTLEGMSTLINTLIKPDVNETISRVLIGDDTGNGTLESPQEESPNDSSSTQNVVFEVPSSDIDFRRIGGEKISMSFRVNGESLMNNMFPNDVFKEICSSTLRFDNGMSFAYKRFPVRTLSRLVDISMTWELSFLYECE